MGHPGVTRTTTAVFRHYYWKSLHKDVAHFVRSCTACATSKASAQLRLGVEGFSPVPVVCFTHWAMDLIGSLSKSRSGHEWIVTWVDRTSKMIVAAAVKTGQSSGRELADLMFTQICCCFGLPAKITHDNDVRFKNVWRDIWRRLGTKIACTSAYDPQADPAERENRQVLEALRAAVTIVVAFDQWDLALLQICCGLNTSISSATGTSPFELAHGFPARESLNLDVMEDVAAAAAGRIGADFALAVQNRLGAEADHVVAAGVRLGRLLEARATPARVVVGKPHVAGWGAEGLSDG